MITQFHTHKKCAFLANYIIFNENLTSAKEALCFPFTWKKSQCKSLHWTFKPLYFDMLEAVDSER